MQAVNPRSRADEGEIGAAYRIRYADGERGGISDETAVDGGERAIGTCSVVGQTVGHAAGSSSSPLPLE